MSATAHVVCVCSEVVMKSTDGVEKVRAKILIIKGNSVFAVCKSCGQEVQVPLQRSITVDAGPPLILSK